MPSYLKTSDVATRLGVSLDTVRRWLRSGELKGAPFGRAGYRIEDADFQAFLNQRRRQPQEFSTHLASSPEQHPLSSETIEEFLNAAGQELRAPLTTTRGALQQARLLLQRALESPLPANASDLLTKLQDLLARAERQISAEMRLVGNLLDASRIEANKFELALVWCNLVEIVRETVINQQELTAQRLFEQELPVDDLVAVLADADRIRQALTNYLTNALKFSPSDQPIKVCLEVNDAQARVSVRDKGPGIPDSEQSRIWERFQQDQRPLIGSGGGLGLGLYLTRAIIHYHRGQVGVESHPGEGSTFWFTLPLADEIGNF
ncbi:MAG TPA: ATP-binding protein [Ktedonobacteraceae bacterium]|nr:ATP-binding protein [Ktedonobacteraceae bacterium]